jgi:hypothetical protein
MAADRRRRRRAALTVGDPKGDSALRAPSPKPTAAGTGQSHAPRDGRLPSHRLGSLQRRDWAGSVHQRHHGQDTVTRLLQKLGVRDMAQAIVLAYQSELFDT